MNSSLCPGPWSWLSPGQGDQGLHSGYPCQLWPPLSVFRNLGTPKATLTLPLEQLDFYPSAHIWPPCPPPIPPPHSQAPGMSQSLMMVSRFPHWPQGPSGHLTLTQGPLGAQGGSSLSMGEVG